MYTATDIVRRINADDFEMDMSVAYYEACRTIILEAYDLDNNLAAYDAVCVLDVTIADLKSLEA